jgi:hypothetical protein
MVLNFSYSLDDNSVEALKFIPKKEPSSEKLNLAADKFKGREYNI